MGNVKILKVSAGSGKTYQLAYAYIRNVIRDPGRYRHILAVTFTNKATEEMKQRIISEINRLACGAPDGYLPELVRDLELPPRHDPSAGREARTRILHDYSHFTIVTIDKFFQRIIRSFIKDLGIDINFNLELQTDPLLDTAADRLIEAIATDDKLRKWIVRFAEEQIDRNGKWDVRSEIVALGRELFREQYKTLQSEPVTPESPTAVVGEAIARSRAVKDEMRRTASEALAVIADAGLRPEDFAYGRQGCTGYLTRINNGEIVPYGKRVQDALGSDDKWVSAKSPHRAKILSLVPQLRGLFGRLCETFDRNFRFLNTTRLLQTNYRSFALLNNLNEKDRGSLRRTAPDPDLETNSIINKGDRRQRYAVYLRKNGQYVLALHDRRIPGHLVAAVAEFRPAARKRRGAAGRISRPAGRRRQTVDLPVAGRRLADSGTESPRSVRADRRADSGHELSQFGNDRRLQQQPDRTVRPVGQRIAEPAARRVRRGGNRIGLPAPRTDRHAGGSLTAT